MLKSGADCRSAKPAQDFVVTRLTCRAPKVTQSVIHYLPDGGTTDCATSGAWQNGRICACLAHQSSTAIWQHLAPMQHKGMHVLSLPALCPTAHQTVCPRDGVRDESSDSRYRLRFLVRWGGPASWTAGHEQLSGSIWHRCSTKACMCCLCRLCAPQHIRRSAHEMVYVMSHQTAGTDSDSWSDGGVQHHGPAELFHACAVCQSSIAPGLLQKQHAQQRQHEGQELRQQACGCEEASSGRVRGQARQLVKVLGCCGSCKGPYGSCDAGAYSQHTCQQLRCRCTLPLKTTLVHVWF